MNKATVQHKIKIMMQLEVFFINYKYGIIEKSIQYLQIKCEQKTKWSIISQSCRVTEAGSNLRDLFIADALLARASKQLIYRYNIIGISENFIFLIQECALAVQRQTQRIILLPDRTINAPPPLDLISDDAFLFVFSVSSYK